MNDERGRQDDQGSLARWCCRVLIGVALMHMVGRIGGVQSRELTPMLSANDRSRWCTVRALVDHGTYAIDNIVFTDAERTKRDNKWQSIDMVRHRGADGREHYYSSKPPLLATVAAGGYWCIKHGLGWEMERDYSAIIRLLLILLNVVPLAIAFWILLRLIERWGVSEWGRVWVVLAMTWGTFLTTFAVTFNNHLPAAVGAIIAAYATFRILDPQGWGRGARRGEQAGEQANQAGWGWHALAGAAAAWATACELPALSLAVALFVGLVWKSPKWTLLGYLPAAALIAAAHFTTSYIAHGTWSPPYAHRQDGAEVAHAAAPVPQPEPGPAAPWLREAFRGSKIELGTDAVVEEAFGDSRWQLWDPASEQRWALRYDPQSMACQVLAWNDWYEYPRSHWRGGEMKGVDGGEPSYLLYAIHVLVGHHGVFSLTPIWLLAVYGFAQLARDSRPALRDFARVTIALTVVCTLFYIFRPRLEDRNYGGVSCGFRWLYWLIPLWIVGLIPAADHCATTPRGRRWAVALLLISVASAAYASAKPFAHPWLYDYFLFREWIVE